MGCVVCNEQNQEDTGSKIVTNGQKSDPVNHNDENPTDDKDSDSASSSVVLVPLPRKSLSNVNINSHQMQLRTQSSTDNYNKNCNNYYNNYNHNNYFNYLPFAFSYQALYGIKDHVVRCHTANEILNGNRIELSSTTPIEDVSTGIAQLLLDIEQFDKYSCPVYNQNINTTYKRKQFDRMLYFDIITIGINSNLKGKASLIPFVWKDCNTLHTILVKIVTEINLNELTDGICLIISKFAVDDNEKVKQFYIKWMSVIKQLMDNQSRINNQFQFATLPKSIVETYFQRIRKDAWDITDNNDNGDDENPDERKQKLINDEDFDAKQYNKRFGFVIKRREAMEYGSDKPVQNKDNINYNDNYNTNSNTSGYYDDYGNYISNYNNNSNGTGVNGTGDNNYHINYNVNQNNYNYNYDYNNASTAELDFPSTCLLKYKHKLQYELENDYDNHQIHVDSPQEQLSQAVWIAKILDANNKEFLNETAGWNINKDNQSQNDHDRESRYNIVPSLEYFINQLENVLYNVYCIGDVVKGHNDEYDHELRIKKDYVNIFLFGIHKNSKHLVLIALCKHLQVASSFVA